MRSKIALIIIFSASIILGQIKDNDIISAESIIENYISVIGGRGKLESIEDRVMILKGVIQGMDINLKILQKAPNKLYQELNFKTGKQMTVFDGKKGKIEGMRQIQILEGETLENLKYQAQLNSFLDYAGNKVILDFDGVVTINGKEAYKLNLKTQNGQNFTHYYDITSGYKLREISEVRSEQGEFKQIIDLDDYREVDGIKHPFKLTQKIGISEIELAVDTIMINSGLSDSLFEIE